MSARIKAGLDQNIVIFQFLCNIPTVEITPPLEENECFLCKESYRNNGWESGGTVHRPVALPCGHILGFQCLVRWMLSTTFDNHCALCRAQIVDAPTTRNQLSRALASSFARLEILAVVAGNGISRAQKIQLLETFENSLWGERALWALTKDSDRVMVVWEEFLEMMCHESATPDEQNPGEENPDDENPDDENADEENPEQLNEPIAVVREDRMDADLRLALHEQVLRWFPPLPSREDHIRLFIYAAFFTAGLLWGSRAELNAMASDPKTVICGGFLGLVVPSCR